MYVTNIESIPGVITSYSIHYTKLYEGEKEAAAVEAPAEEEAEEQDEERVEGEKGLRRRRQGKEGEGGQGRRGEEAARDDEMQGEFPG